MLVNPAQSHFKFECLDQSPVGSFDSLAPLQPKANGIRKSPGSYHRRSVSCLAVASHHEHYEHPSYYAAASGRYYDTIEVSEGSASPVTHTRHIQRKSEGAISIGQLQRSLSNAGLVNVSTAAADGKTKDGDYTMVSVPSGPLSGKLVKVRTSTVKKKNSPVHPPPLHPRSFLYHPASNPLNTTTATTMQIHQQPAESERRDCRTIGIDSGCYATTPFTFASPTSAPSQSEQPSRLAAISIFTLGPPQQSSDLEYPTYSCCCSLDDRSGLEDTSSLDGATFAASFLFHIPTLPLHSVSSPPPPYHYQHPLEYTGRLSNASYSHLDTFYFQKVNVTSPTATPRRSLLSDLLNNQGAPTRLEQNANRRRMLKSMRRYSVDASEMNFSLGGPSSRATPLTSIPSEEGSESSSSSSTSPMLIESRQTGFSATPTVRYLRNPCHAAIKTKLQPSAFRGTLQRRGADENGERPDYFGADDRVW
ncbi:hypothetical protein EMPS_08005 [Entomortierella parvispora]|uniref:Uncharacterized protein n=1 Tax=Entomortierella parvispora TaxID=205924 RepID=A0A9P3HG18_9FUNG|nr:hypothetical protein EMPS_08005 [Entomortierella parvispora]